MTKDTDITLTCHRCGKEFAITQSEQELCERKRLAFPDCCPQCRSERQERSQHLVCSQCGAALSKRASVYCATCLASSQHEFEQRASECQRSADEVQSKLLITESQKAELAKSLRQKEQLIAALEQQTSNLSQEMEKVHQFHASSSQLLQLTLMEIEERLEAVEQGQRESSQRIIEQIHMIQERSESSNLRE